MKNNNKKIKEQKYVSEDMKEISRLIFITLGIVIIVLGLYFLTDKVALKDKDNETSSSDFDYSAAIVGTMFNRPYSEYYVFLYDATDDNANQYQSLVSTYEAKEEAKKIYFVDLSKSFNSKYLSDKSNPNPTNPSEVQIKDSALVLIKNGKVANYYENVEDYEKVLS